MALDDLLPFFAMYSELSRLLRCKVCLVPVWLIKNTIVKPEKTFADLIKFIFLFSSFMFVKHDALLCFATLGIQRIPLFLG